MKTAAVLLVLAVLLLAAGGILLFAVPPGPWDLLAAGLSFAAGMCGFAVTWALRRGYCSGEAPR